jgi:hypothetical protein
VLQSFGHFHELAVTRYCPDTNTVIPAKAGIQFVIGPKAIFQDASHR